jgi:hypothetical protein
MEADGPETEKVRESDSDDTMMIIVSYRKLGGGDGTEVGTEQM